MLSFLTKKSSDGGRGDVTFIQRDVSKQVDLARDILDMARQLDEIIAQAQSTEERDRLQKIRDRAVQNAQELAENARATSNTASRMLSE